MQLLEDIARLADLQYLDVGGIGVVNVLGHVHDANEQEEAFVDFTHQPLVVGGREGRQKGLSAAGLFDILREVVG